MSEPTQRGRGTGDGSVRGRTRGRSRKDRRGRAGRSGAGPPGRVLLLLGAALFLAGCDGLLDVELPTRIGSEALEDPASAEVLVNSAIGDFECALNNYVPATGLIGDELRHATGARAIFLWDQRRITSKEDTKGCEAFTNPNATSRGYGVYRPMQIARSQAEDVLRRLDGWTDAQVPNRTELRATAAAYAGYALTHLGEGWCEMALDGGPLLTPDGVLARAEERFRQAVDLARTAGATEILNMARVGRARTLLDLERDTEAAEVARQVPRGFVRTATRSASVEARWNLVYEDNVNRGVISVDPGFADLEWRDTADSRVPVEEAPRPGSDQSTLYWQRKYESRDAPIRIASWEEARLVVAEAEGGETAVDIINEFHDRAGLPPFESQDPAEIEDHVVEERSRVLFLEGHRLNDMLRHDLAFDTGVGHDGVPYGSTTCMPLPQTEIEGNPNL